MQPLDDLFAVDLYVYALVLLLFVYADYANGRQRSEHLWAPFLLVVNRGAIIVLIFLGLASSPITVALELITTVCLIWILISFTPGLPPNWQGVGFAVVLPFLITSVFVSTQRRPALIYNTIIPTAAIPLIFISTRQLRWQMQAVYLAAPVILILAGLLDLSAFPIEASEFLNLLAYVCLIGLTYWRAIQSRSKEEQPSESFTGQPQHVPDDPTHRPGDMLQDRFEIKEKISHGGFAAVYRVVDHELKDAEVVIKSFNYQAAVHFNNLAEMEKLFKQEARIMRRLRHRHILRVYDSFGIGPRYYIVMPFMPDTLAARLEKFGHLSVSEAVNIMIQICEGLRYAHLQRWNGSEAKVVVHCDIKPGNILFNRADEVKIADFGIAHIPLDTNATSAFSGPHFNAGTLYYMSPEQLLGKRDIPQIDVYALGALFYRMLTGAYYLDFDLSDNPEAATDNRLRIHNERPLQLPLDEKNVPQPLIDIIFTALAKEPEARFSNAGEIVEALEAFKRGKIFDQTKPQPVEPIYPET